MAFWDKITSRGNVEDRRSNAPLAIGGGLGGIVLIAALTYLSGGDLGDVLSQLQNLPAQQVAQEQQVPPDDTYQVFASTVVGSTNDYWTDTFAKNNLQYEKPTLVLFRYATQSSCGGAQSLVGPHFCPTDQKIYLDETFFDQLQSQFGGGSGDVAQAYVIAHEVGHNVQNQLNLLTGDDSIKQELQADCFAGLWANSIKDQGVFEAGEIKEALDAAAAVGDDNIQQKTEGQITPETWTHGSSEQRMASFNAGYDSGSLSACGVK